MPRPGSLANEMRPPSAGDDAVDRREAETGSFTRRLRREERFERVLDRVGSHAGARVRHAQAHELTLIDVIEMNVSRPPASRIA